MIIADPPKNCLRRAETVPLTRLKSGETAMVSKFATEDPKKISSLSALGIVAGAEIKLESVAPFNGPLMLRVGHALYAIEAALSRQILVKREVEATVALIGNPNCGKSTMFQALTGLDIETANYAGTTIEVHRAITEHHGNHLELIDLPGIYSIGGANEDEKVTRKALIDANPDATIVALDSLNLARNLFLLLQVIELGYPVAVALNFADLAKRLHLHTDEKNLSEILGVPVVSTIATTGKGLDELMHSLECRQRGVSPRYSATIEALFAEVGSLLQDTDLPPRAAAITVLECEGVLEIDPDVAKKIEEIGQAFLEKHGERPEHRIARERHGLAGILASQVQTNHSPSDSFATRFWHWSITPGLGLFILGGIVVAMMAFLFLVSGFLNEGVNILWASLVSPAVKALAFGLLGKGIASKILLWGFDSGLLAVISVGVAYILPFFFLLGLLEDSGYYGSIVFLTDRLMHRFGLHGRSVISLVSALGCNVPAIMSTRILPHRRERFIAATLATMVPCAPRIAVITGGVALAVGPLAGFGVLIVVLATVISAGLLLNRLMPGESHGFVMEMFPLRRPNLRPTLRKTWKNFKDFLFVGLPFVVLGCLLLGGLYETGKIWILAAPLRPLMEGFLGIPVIAGLTLVFAFLRKELALQLLLTFAIAGGHPGNNILSIMTPKQLIVFALVNTLYIPCIASVGGLIKVLGWKETLGIALITLMTALLVGGAANLVLH
jgi:ferrous iron transport protein B